MHNIVPVLSIVVKFNALVDCPVCYRVVNAAKGMSKRDSIKVSDAFASYCNIDKGLEISDEKLCYDVTNMKTSLYRLLDLGASVDRVCKKVKEINSDFCRKGEISALRRDVDFNPNEGGGASEGGNKRIKEQPDSDVVENTTDGEAIGNSSNSSRSENEKERKIKAVINDVGEIEIKPKEKPKQVKKPVRGVIFE